MEKEKKGEIRLSPSSIIMMETCAKQYQYRYLLGVRPKVRDRKMLLGDIRHQAIERIVRTDLPTTVDEPCLTEKERDSINQEMDAFYRWWMDMGFVPLFFDDGLPAIELKLEAVHPDDPEIILVTRLDIAAIDNQDQVWLLDWKSGSTNTSQIFVDHSDQLTFMQICFEPYLKGMGIDQLDKLGIVDIHGPTKEKPARIKGPIWTQRRSSIQVADLLKKAIEIKNRILREEFCRTSRYGFNCPCAMCEYEALCRSTKNQGEYTLREPGILLPAGLEDL